ncbi:MAG: PASTA domain-containing protein [Alistipes sp.]|nr:PASTA domain-containing protein [Alistipes sp.]
MAKKSSTKRSGAKGGSSSKSGSAKNDILLRVRVLYLLFILVGFGVAARLVWVQMFSDSVAHNAAVLKEGVVREVTIPAHRGAILTRDGEPLAMSSLRYEPTFDFKSDGFNDAPPQEFEHNVDELSKLLSQHFDMEDARNEGYDYISATEYKDIFHAELSRGTARAKKIFPRPVTLDEWEMMTSEFPILNGNMGMVYGVKRVDKRIHPMGEMAHQLIGVDKSVVDNGESTNSTGIERIYDDYLAGEDGQAKEQYIAHGFWSRINDPSNKAPKDGCDIVTTIDGGLQRAATEILRRELEGHKGSFGVAMVMEVETGDMLCMVNLSTGRVRGTNFSEKGFNHAMKTSQSPGSTFKLAATMVLIERCGYTLDTSISIPTKEKKVGTRKVTDSHTIKYENGKPIVNITLKDGFAHSSNIYFAEAIYENFKDNPKLYWEYLDSLHFNKTVGLDAYGEVAGHIPVPMDKEWKSIHGSLSKSLPYLGYGYIVTVPPIHTLTFFNGVANGGRMVAPRIVDHIERDGKVIEVMPTEVIMDRMCSDRTIELLHECLAAAAVPERTKRRFAELPFKIGCKTGTAEINGPFQSDAQEDKQKFANILNYNYNLGSVVCMMPLEKPKYTVMVAMAKESMFDKDTHFGIDVAAPAANEIMQYIYNNDRDLHPTVSVAPSPYAPTNIKGGDSRAVNTVSSTLAPYVSNSAIDAAWCNTTTDDGGSVAITAVDITEDIVPDVRNMGLSDALYILEGLGLEVTHEGAGRIVEQSLEAGSTIRGSGGTIHLTLDI